MTLPVEQFNPETFEQANPFLTGMLAGQQAVTNQMQIGNQAFQQNLQAQYAPQMMAAQLAYAKQQAPNLQAQTQAITQGQIPLQQAYAQELLQGKLPLETLTNQLYQNNPAMLLPGGAGSLSALAYLQQHYPAQYAQFFGGVNTSLPTNSANNNSNAPSSRTLPPNTIASAGTSTSPFTNNITPGMAIAFPNLISAQKNVAQMDYYKTAQARQQLEMAAKAWSIMTPSMKDYTFAQGRAFGMTPDDVTQLYLNGGNLSQVAAKQGYDPSNQQSWPSPEYAPTTTTVNRAQMRNQWLN